MYLDSLVWMNDHINTALKRLIQENRLHHFLILTSLSIQKANLCARAVALDWVSSSTQKKEDHLLHIQHPDMHVLRPQGKSGSYTVESVRGAIQEIALKPFMGEKRAIIIESGERMSLPAANALLKALEEPPPHTIFLMTAVHTDRLMATILSRGQIIRIRSESSEDSKCEGVLSEEVQKILENFFQDPFQRPSYAEIRSWARQYSAHFESRRKLALKEFSASLGDEKFEGEGEEYFLSSWPKEDLERCLSLIRKLWQKSLVLRGNEMGAVDGRRRFPDETISAFQDGLRAGELGFDSEEIVSQLLLTLFGYIQPSSFISRNESFCSLIL